MRRAWYWLFWWWLLLFLFFVGVVLFLLGLYFTYGVGERRLGYDFSVVGAVLLGVLLAVGMLYVARVRVKILRGSRDFSMRYCWFLLR
ncbi:MAG: hypothetical protein ACQXXE_03355 [Candidatus Bathyarchaeia archaeon]|nr:hypothetical protein [Candidatus Bathyarchaeota archaeon A05DMB-5]